MAATKKFDQATRDAICREWARALPGERQAIADRHGFHNSLPGYWRRQGLWPKDLTTPVSHKPAPAATAEKPALKVEPRDFKAHPYSLEERLAIKAEHTRAQAEGPAAVRAFSLKWGKPGWLYDEKIAAPAKWPHETKARVVKAVDEAKAATGRPLNELFAEALKEAGLRSMHWTTYYTWRKAIAKPPATIGRPKAKAKNPGGKGVPKSVRTLAQKLALVREVNERREAGERVRDICASLGVRAEAYRQWAAGRRLRPHNGRPPKPNAIQAANVALAKTNGHHKPADNAALMAVPVRGAVRSVAQQLGEMFRRLKAMGTIVTKVETDADGGVVRITTQTTETIEL